MWRIEETISRSAAYDVIYTGESRPTISGLVREERSIMIEVIENLLTNWNHFAYHDNHGTHIPARMAVLKRKP